MQVDMLRKQYSDNIMLQVQQLTTKVAQYAYQKSDCAGGMSFQDQIGAATALEKTARNQLVVNSDPSYDRRKISPRYFYVAPLIDNMDKLMLVKDPTSEVVQSNAAALAVAKDTVVCNALFDTAYGGKEGTDTFTLSGSQVVANGATAMTIEKIRKAKKVMDINQVPDTDRYFVVSARQIYDMLAITEITSTDYAQVQALVNGMPGTVCGFKFIVSENLPIASTIRKTAAFHRTGICLGTWLDLKASIDLLPAKHFSAQVYAGQSYGATRLEEKKVVEVDCVEV